MSFLRHGEIYRSDVAMKSRERRRCPLPALIGVDESPAGYSLAGCAPAEPASASPAGIRMWRGDVPMQRNPMELVTIKGASKRIRQPRPHRGRVPPACAAA